MNRSRLQAALLFTLLLATLARASFLPSGGNPLERSALLDGDWKTHVQFKKGEPRPTGRISLPTYKYWLKDDPLPPSGLIGLVRLVSQNPEVARESRK